MALKPTIYKFNIQLADIDQNHYDTFSLTVALHPSETGERMMARVMAFCLNAGEDITFTRGLCAAQEPDIWARTPDDRISLWIDVGEPAFDRIKKACRVSSKVRVYAFHYRAEDWWAREMDAFSRLGVEIYQFQWQGIQALAEMVERTMDLSVTLSDGTAYVSGRAGDWALPWTVLKPPAQ